MASFEVAYCDVQRALNDFAIGRNQDENETTLALQELKQSHEARVSELLTSNNEMRERAMAAEAKVSALTEALLAAARVGGALGDLITNQRKEPKT